MSLEIEKEISIDAECYAKAQQELKPLINEYEVVKIDYRIEHRADDRPVFHFTILHYVGPKQARKPFNPVSFKEQHKEA